MSYRVINIYYSVTCYTNHINSTSFQSMASMALSVFPDAWGSIVMDFIGPFPPSKGFDYMWVMLCRLMSMVHLILVNMTIRASQLTCVYVKEIV